MEQDTAKTILQPPNTHLLDFNRVSHPLIEIITLPHIHRPRTAAALVRKVQTILKAVGANTTGMEMGGLRADVNVSVRLHDGSDSARETLEYSGVKGLSQRTEIKNLSSFKAVEDAIVAERDRQIRVLESGGRIEGETRGWTLGSSGTQRLRGKEGEVDYRYLPDPDLGVVRVGEVCSACISLWQLLYSRLNVYLTNETQQDLLSHLRNTLPTLPDALLSDLTTSPTHALPSKDAKTLLQLDDGDRLDYYLSVLAHLTHSATSTTSPPTSPSQTTLPNTTPAPHPSRTVLNYTLHELGALLSTQNTPFTPQRIPASTLASILRPLLRSEITAPTAKTLLGRAFSAGAETPWQPTDVARVLDEEGLRLVQLSDGEYLDLAREVVRGNGDMAGKVRGEVQKSGGDVNGRGVRGKVMWFVGRMMKMEGEGSARRRRMSPLQPERAEEAVRRVLFDEA